VRPFHDIKVWGIRRFNNLWKKQVMFNRDFGHYCKCMIIDGSLCHILGEANDIICHPRPSCFMNNPRSCALESVDSKLIVGWDRYNNYLPVCWKYWECEVLCVRKTRTLPWGRWPFTHNHSRNECGYSNPQMHPPLQRAHKKFNPSGWGGGGVKIITLVSILLRLESGCICAF
jgi:hypothetical protein